MCSKIDLPYFENLNKIATVSKECKLVLEDVFPTLIPKQCILKNIISPKTIKKLSKEKVEINKNRLILMSVGRLNRQKGYDLVVETCEILVKSGIFFNWFIIGDGEEKNNIEKEINKKNLQDYLILLGEKENPYSYLSKADIFVHTARFEGYGIVITEAKILGLPMVITNFNIAK
jgi:glycosyltransferase involved in cell wall biosynthesis